MPGPDIWSEDKWSEPTSGQKRQLVRKRATSGQIGLNFKKKNDNWSEKSDKWSKYQKSQNYSNNLNKNGLASSKIAFNFHHYVFFCLLLKNTNCK